MNAEGGWGGICCSVLRFPAAVLMVTVSVVLERIASLEELSLLPPELRAPLRLHHG